MEDIYDKMEDDPDATVIFNGAKVEGGIEGLERKLNEVFADMTGTMSCLVTMSKELKTMTKTDNEKAYINDVIICAEKIRQSYVEAFEMDRWDEEG